VQFFASQCIIQMIVDFWHILLVRDDDDGLCVLLCHIVRLCVCMLS